MMKIKSRISTFIIIYLIIYTSKIVNANDIDISNVNVQQYSEAGYKIVGFDIQWSNSWRANERDGLELENWDAAWVFIKYRLKNGIWRHAKLRPGVSIPGDGSPILIEEGLKSEKEAWNRFTNQVLGVFIYHSENSEGELVSEGVKLVWDLAADDVTFDQIQEVKVFGIEMVYVPPGPFYVGGDGTDLFTFKSGGLSENQPFLISSEWSGCISDSISCLWVNGSQSLSGNLDDYFPTGFDGFYVMKYEMSQQQYVDFLNTLSFNQQKNRIMGNPDGESDSYIYNTNRNKIKILQSGEAPDTPAFFLQITQM